MEIGTPKKTGWEEYLDRLEEMAKKEKFYLTLAAIKAERRRLKSGINESA
jgi:hypothetical protein